MKTFIEFKQELNEGNIYADIVPRSVKQVKSKAWAKKYVNKFHDLLTTAGDTHGLSIEMTPKQIVAGDPSVMTRKGVENFKRKLNGVLSIDMDLGVNIAGQIVDKLNDKDLLKIVNNLGRKFDGIK